MEMGGSIGANLTFVLKFHNMLQSHVSITQETSYLLKHIREMLFDDSK